MNKKTRNYDSTIYYDDDCVFNTHPYRDFATS